MDLGTVIGIVLIMALLGSAMVMGVGIGAYIDVPSALIVVGGSIGALMISFKPAQMKQFTKIFMIAIKPPQDMADPSAIGPSMAVALLTTMYGAIIGNVFGTPIYNILAVRNDEETLVQEMILSGIMSIQSGDAPRVLEAKLLSYLPPADRVSQFD